MNGDPTERSTDWTLRLARLAVGNQQLLNRTPVIAVATGPFWAGTGVPLASRIQKLDHLIWGNVIKRNGFAHDQTLLISSAITR